VAGPAYPGGQRFAFTVIDDTDVATVANVAPLYRLLQTLGLRATKTVWPMACPEGSRDFAASQTLEDPAYRAFALELHRAGFEIASHGATMESSERARTLAALDRFRDVFGTDPRVYANHAYNQENLYWGVARLDDPLLKLFYARLNGRPRGFYLGHVEHSPYWWGDVCAARIHYVRNLTFNALNLARVNPSMPYHDPTRPLVPRWFSATDAEDADEFVTRLRPDGVDELEREGGFCVLATHFGKGYVVDGRVRTDVARRLEDLARRPAWFPTVSELLDWLAARRGDARLPAAEWRRMQWRWARDLAVRRWRRVSAARPAPAASVPRSD
jgi:hypothetical protein